MSESKPTWWIWVCGCKGKVTERDWAYDDGVDEPCTCGACKESYREIEVEETTDA